MAQNKNDCTLDTSIPTASLESILCTEELQRRPSRPSDYEKESRALAKLATALADSPRTILQILAETIQEITQCDSAGLSLLTRDGKQKRIAAELERRVAERRSTEEALRGSELSLRLILDGIAGLVVIMGATGEVETVNRQVLEYFGKSLEEVKGWSATDAVHPDDLPGAIAAWRHLPDGPNEYLSKPWHDYTGLSPEDSHGWGWQLAFHPEDLPPLMKKWQELSISGAPGEIEARLRRRDGVYRWFLIRVQPLRNDEGEIVRWYGTSTDIEDRKVAEEALARSEAFLAEGQRLSRTGSFSWCVQSGEIACSEQLYRIFEFEQGTTVTLERIGSRFHPEDLPILNAMIDRTREGASDFEYEHRLLMPDHTVKYLHLVARRDTAGRLEYIGAVQDVTQRRLSEEALGRARSEHTRVARVTSLGMLTAAIAHEVNQPLSGIITNASTCLRMLSADPPNIDGARETVRRTIRDGNRASDVITRLRTLYCKKEPVLESMDLNEAAREVAALSSTEIQRNGVTLRQELADDLPPALGDRVQLQQVILNLLRNAVDAMSAIDDRPRELLIRTERDEDHQLRLSVKDSGVGLAPEAAEKIFEAFYTTKTDGMGIGLSISRSIIETHQGRLRATRNEGPGSTFSFSIPCWREDLANPETRVKRADTSTGPA